MSISLTPFLRNVLIADAVVSSAAAILMAGGASLLAPLLELPEGLLFWAGIVLLPWIAMLFYVVRNGAVSRARMTRIIVINALWVAASFGLLLSGTVSPNTLGIAFVTVQALVVALLAELQFVGSRRAEAVAA